MGNSEWEVLGKNVSVNYYIFKPIKSNIMLNLSHKKT